MQKSIVFAVLAVAGCSGWRMQPQPTATPTQETVNGITYHMPYGRPTRPFTPAVQVGNLLFVSGQIGTAPNAQGQVVPGGIQAETRQTLNNIRDVLEKSGSSMDRVVKCTVFMADMREWDAMNEVYMTFWPGNTPARSALGANGVAVGARVEIECFAVAA